MNPITLRQIAIALAIAPLLITLFIKAQAPDPIRHHRILSSLHKIESMNAEIDILTLQFRYRLQSNYDGLVFAVKEIGLRYQELTEGEDAIYNKGNEKIDRVIQDLGKAISQKEELVEGFKSHNAVLNNSLYYFPRLVEETTRLVPVYRNLHSRLQSLMHDLLMLHMGMGYENSFGKTENAIRQVEGGIYPSPAVKENIKRLAQHAKYILMFEREVSLRIEQITSATTHDLVRELTSGYEESFNRSFKIANYYYLFIYISQ